MVTATRPAATAVAVMPPPSDEMITKMLRGMGALEPANNDFNRIKVEGTVFSIDDEPFVYNPKTDNAAFVGRIIDSPIQYQALYIDEAAAAALERPESAGKYCKSHFANPNEARKYSDSGYSCEQCPASPFSKNSPLEQGKKCQWKGDLQVQIVDPETGRFREVADPDTGELRPDERIFTLSLSTTGMIEWQGTKKDGVAGSASAMNFIHKLAQLAITRQPDADPSKAIRDAINALGLGMVIAEFRLLKQENKDKGRTWTVISVTPIDILEFTETITPLIEAGDPLAIDPDDVPF